MSLDSNVRALVQRLGNESKALRTLLNGNAADLQALSTTAKANLVGAINELYGLIQNASAINDSSTGASTSWSSSKTKQYVDAAVAGLPGGATAADRDTIKELGDLLAGSDSAIAAINAALANRVRYDAAQSLTTAQQAQARTNIGAASAADVGPTDTDFVAIYNSALA